MVRDTLGEDAIIVATREEHSGVAGSPAVRVTAAIDPDNYNPPTAPQKAPAFEIGAQSASTPYSDRAPVQKNDDWLQYDEEDEISAVTEEITDAMLRHNVPEDIMDQIISCATVLGVHRTDVALTAALEHLFSFTPLPQGVSNKPIMLIGAAGSGKTLAAAKLAARGAMNGLNIGVITTDTVRAGGVEQLRSFTTLLGIELQTASTPDELHTAVEILRGCDQIIIDTQSTNPFNQSDVQHIAKMVAAAGHEMVRADAVLVMPAAGDADEAGEIAKIFAAIGVNHLMPSRLDGARRLGCIISAAHQGALLLTEAGNNPKVAEGFKDITPASFAALLMPALESRFRQSKKQK